MGVGDLSLVIKMKLFLVALIFFVMPKTWANSREHDESIDYVVSSYYVFKLLDVINEQFYGPTGKSPRSEAELMKFCTPQNKDMRYFLDGLEYKKQVISKMRKENDRDYSEVFDIFTGSNSTVEGDVVEKTNEMYKTITGPEVYGYCNVQDSKESKKCKTRDESCPQASKKIIAKFRNMANETNILQMDFYSFCRKFMHTLIRGQEVAIGDLEMCRRNKEDLKSHPED